MIKIQNLTSISFYSWGTPRISDSRVIFIYRRDVESIKSKLDTFKNNRISAGDKVFFSKSSKVPRYKFGEYTSGTGKGTSRTIKLDSANTVVVNPDSILQSITNNTRRHSFHLIDKKMLGGHGNHSWTQFVLVSDDQIDPLSTFMNISLRPMSLGQVDVVTSYDAASFKTGLEEWNSIEASILTKKIIHDNTLLEDINQGIVLDNDTVEQLVAMLTSNDDANITLGMDLMANCDYRASELHLAMLLNGYNNIMQSNSAWKLVNFQSMLQYMKDYSWNEDPVRFAEAIVKNTDITKPGAQERIEIARKMMMKHVEGILTSKIFKIEEISVNA
jgi:hypothetical protein